MLTGITRAARLSPCGSYRWTLTRTWEPSLPILLVVMFNPSTATAEVDDPTITLTCQIAAHNGFGGIVVVNLCPLRSSQPDAAIKMLQDGHDYENVDLRRILWENLQIIEEQVDAAGAVLIAWGANGGYAGDWYRCTMQTITERRPAKPVYHLGSCANGHPKHPLARGKHKVPKDAPLILWSTR